MSPQDIKKSKRNQKPQLLTKLGTKQSEGACLVAHEEQAVAYDLDQYGC